MELGAIGRTLILFGVIIVIVGLALSFSERIPFLGRLPGDVTLRGDRWTVYVPIATSIVLSVLLTLILTAVAWIGRR